MNRYQKRQYKYKMVYTFLTLMHNVFVLVKIHNMCSSKTRKNSQTAQTCNTQ